MAKYLLTILISIFLITACDDTGTTVSPVTSPNVGEIALNWLGDFVSHPTTCEASNEYDAYYNTTEGKSYFCDGIDWRMVAQDGTDGTNGIDGTDGADGMTIQVSDGNSTLLGYSISLEILFSPNGYLYFVQTNDGTVKFYSTANDVVYFMNNDCTGTPLVRMATEAGTRSILLHDSLNDVFYKRKNTTVHTTTPQSYVNIASECTAYSTSTTFYELESITRVDAGIPETITLPLNYEFK